MCLLILAHLLAKQYMVITDQYRVPVIAAVYMVAHGMVNYPVHGMAQNAQDMTLESADAM